MDINFKTITGTTITVVGLTEDMTVLQIRKIISKQEKIAFENISLIFAGEKLDDQKTIGEFNLREESTVYLRVTIKKKVQPPEKPKAEVKEEQPPEKPKVQIPPSLVNDEKFDEPLIKEGQKIVIWVDDKYWSIKDIVKFVERKYENITIHYFKTTNACQAYLEKIDDLLKVSSDSVRIVTNMARRRKNGRLNINAGFELIKEVRKKFLDVKCMVFTSEKWFEETKKKFEEIKNVDFTHKVNKIAGFITFVDCDVILYNSEDFEDDEFTSVIND